MTRTPVALIVFNRPDATEHVLNEIAKARPKQLFVIADGPRDAKDVDKCRATRAVIDRIDWDCAVTRNYSETNLGVGLRPASGIKWVFDHVEEAIIFEDDCVPHPSFFPYCDEMLQKYRDDQRVMHISGDNWNFTPTPRPYSYIFSNYCYSCGWATWRRAFQYYDPEIKLWPELRQTPWLLDILEDPRAVEFWASKFDSLIQDGGIQKHGWDWPWLFACWTHHGLSILPGTNLISNIGFSAEATHTKSADDARANVPMVEMAFPLRHPPYMVRDGEVDRAILRQVGLRPEDLYQRVRRNLVSAFPPGARQSLIALRTALVGRK